MVFVLQFQIKFYDFRLSSKFQIKFYDFRYKFLVVELFYNLVVILSFLAAPIDLGFQIKQKGLYIPQMSFIRPLGWLNNPYTRKNLSPLTRLCIW